MGFLTILIYGIATYLIVNLVLIDDVIYVAKQD